MKQNMKKLFKTLRSLKGVEVGSRAFIVANGPSAMECDLSLLKGEVVIGMNASTILENKFEYFSKYYVVSDKRFMSNPEKRKWATDELNRDTLRFLRSDIFDSDDVSLYDRTFYVPALERDGFSKNLAAGYNYGCTTTMFALQLAYYLGIREVYLIGCDLRYPDESPRFYKETVPEVEDSFASVQIKNIYNAHLAFKDDGGRVVSCSQNSFLRSYLPYSEFSSLF